MTDDFKKKQRMHSIVDHDQWPNRQQDNGDTSTKLDPATFSF